MSRYSGQEYNNNNRGPPLRDRSRSPPRFSDRRPSAVAGFDNRPSGPPRNASNAPRGPRSQFDGSTRGPPPAGLGSAAAPRSLREAPPLGTGERGRPFRERDYDRGVRGPSPRERSPPGRNNFKDSRDLPPRDLDINRARRGSRDGPPSAGSNLSGDSPFSSAPSFRGGFARGRGRGDFEHRGGRGGRRGLDDRDLFRRGDRSPPPRFSRDLSQDCREPDRRGEGRFERRDEDRRPEWLDRERESDRVRRDPAPQRVEQRPSNDPLPSTGNSYQALQEPPINPQRLAIIESSGADTSVRRPSVIPAVAPVREPRRDPPPETPSYLNGRADSTANRYGSRGSSPPTQAAPPVPAFSFSIGPTAPVTHPSMTMVESKPSPVVVEEPSSRMDTRPEHVTRPIAPSTAPAAPKLPPAAPKALLAGGAPLAAPKAPRTLETEVQTQPSSRLQGVRSMDGLAGQNGVPRAEAVPHAASSGVVPRNSLPSLAQPVSPRPLIASRFGELAAPTGPKATRNSSAVPSVSPGIPLASPRSDIGGTFASTGFQRARTPPPSAPSGPRLPSFSVSPKATHSSIPTAPKAARMPPSAPRAPDRPMQTQVRGPERPGGLPPSAPSGPRIAPGLWNFNRLHQWKRLPAGQPERPVSSIPAKRDALGGEKELVSQSQALVPATPAEDRRDPQAKTEGQNIEILRSTAAVHDARESRMEIDENPVKRAALPAENHSAAQSFFGQAVDPTDDPMDSSSDEDELDDEEDATFLDAKHAREEKELRAQLVDLSLPEYRALIPLEKLARLGRITQQDLQRFSERPQETEVDGPPAAPEQRALPAVQTSESDDAPKAVTPKGETGANFGVQDQDSRADFVRRKRRGGSEEIVLPYLVKKEDAQPFDESDRFKENLRLFAEEEAGMLALMVEEKVRRKEADAKLGVQFADYLRQWQDECDALDEEQEEQEKLGRLHSTEPGPEADAPFTAAAIPTESRRLLKFSSEYDIEQVLKQSEETARREQEKAERELRKSQADMEKEAKLPDQLQPDQVRRTTFFNTNTKDPKSLLKVFSYQPATDNFSDGEKAIFAAYFKEMPKQWGKIADQLQNTKLTYVDCIRHYYRYKWDGRFRDNKAKKFRGGKRGRGKTRAARGGAMADMNRGEEVPGPSTETGRPKRAAAPTTFGEKEVESKNALADPSPAKRATASKQENDGEGGVEKVKKKPGRKPKAQPLATIAAAPALASSSKAFVPGMPAKEEQARAQESARAQSLEDASLLASFQGGQHSLMHPNGQVFTAQEGYIGHVLPPSDNERPKPVATSSSSSAKQGGASSYWSVPEQQDFAKYIGHFGTDFAAIAAHMGTKTQTMIKNHYSRQVEGGRVELEKAATDANARRARGDDLGPPPVPTPITKRKYDNPQAANAPRARAPQTDLMETDDVGMSSVGPPAAANMNLAAATAAFPAVAKHASPPQFQPKFVTSSSAQNTPVLAQRVVPSPVVSTTTPISTPMSMMPHSRAGQQQQQLGSHLGYLNDPRSESRQSLQAGSVAHIGREPTVASARSQAPPLPARALSHVPDSQTLHTMSLNAQLEQQKALQMQKDVDQQTHHRQGPMQNARPFGSAMDQLMHGPPKGDRKMGHEERPYSPPRGSLPGGVISRPLFGSGGTLGPTPLSLTARSSNNPTPFNVENSRPGSVSSLGATLQQQAPPPSKPPVPIATSAPEPPKRSNLMSILNNDSEESRPAPPSKRDSLPTPAARVASPANSAYPRAPTPQAMPGNLPSRRDTTFGQATRPGSNFDRTSFMAQVQQVSTPGPQPHGSKHEPLAGASTAHGSHQHPLQEWPRFHAHGNAPSPPNVPQLEREVRPYYQHRNSALGALSQPMQGNPSPPPHVGHSRTPSTTTNPTAPPPREQRSMIGGQSQGPPSQTNAPNLHSSPYGAQQQRPQPPPFSDIPNRNHHAHNGSIHSMHSSEPGPAFVPTESGGYVRRSPMFDRSRTGEEEVQARMRQQQFLLEQERMQFDHHASGQRGESQQQHTQKQNQQQQQYEMVRQRDQEIAMDQHRLQMHQQQQQALQQQAQQAHHSHAQQPPPPPPFSRAPPQGSVFGNFDMQRRGIREMSRDEGMRAMQEQQMQIQQQQHRDSEMRRQDEQQLQHREREQQQQQQQSVEVLRRWEGEQSRRSTPFGGAGFGHAPPPPGSQGGQGRR